MSVFGWGVLKQGSPKIGRVLYSRPPDVHIFGTDPSVSVIMMYFRYQLFSLSPGSCGYIHFNAFGKN